MCVPACTVLQYVYPEEREKYIGQDSEVAIKMCPCLDEPYTFSQLSLFRLLLLAPFPVPPTKCVDIQSAVIESLSSC